MDDGRFGVMDEIKSDEKLLFIFQKAEIGTR